MGAQQINRQLTGTVVQMNLARSIALGGRA
jgi:hypothetical protein